MRKISSLPNSIPDSTDYPFGRIKDQTGSELGTPIIEQTYSDYIQSLCHFMTIAGVVPNGMPDNSSNGFQIFRAMEIFFEPIGSLRAQAGSTYDERFLPADGRLLNKNDYPDAFNAWGYTYGGSGDTFAIPDNMRYFQLAAGSEGNAGSTGGESEHTLTVAEMPSHSHDDRHLSSHSGSALGYNGVDGVLDHAFVTGSIGGGQAHNNIPPFMRIPVLVKVKYRD